MMAALTNRLIVWSVFYCLPDPALIISLQMDDNLRKSPQHPPRKLTTLKLAAGGEASSPLNRLSPWQLLLPIHVFAFNSSECHSTFFHMNVVLQGKNPLRGTSKEEIQLYNLLSTCYFKKLHSLGWPHAKLRLKQTRGLFLQTLRVILYSIILSLA